MYIYMRANFLRFFLLIIIRTRSKRNGPKLRLYFNYKNSVNKTENAVGIHRLHSAERSASFKFSFIIYNYIVNCSAFERIRRKANIALET